MYPQFPLSQPDCSNLALGADEQCQAVALGGWLFVRGGAPLVVLEREANPRYGRQDASLEGVCAPIPGRAPISLPMSPGSCSKTVSSRARLCP